MIEELDENTVEGGAVALVLYMTAVIEAAAFIKMQGNDLRMTLRGRRLEVVEGLLGTVRMLEDHTQETIRGLVEGTNNVTRAEIKRQLDQITAKWEVEKKKIFLEVMRAPDQTM